MQKSLYSREQEVLCRMLRRLRRAADLTQEQLAARLERPRSFVSRYESGEKALELVEVRHILRALGAAFVDFLREYDAALESEGL